MQLEDTHDIRLEVSVEQLRDAVERIKKNPEYLNGIAEDPQAFLAENFGLHVNDSTARAIKTQVDARLSASSAVAASAVHVDII